MLTFAGLQITAAAPVLRMLGRTELLLSVHSSSGSVAIPKKPQSSTLGDQERHDGVADDRNRSQSRARGRLR